MEKRCVDYTETWFVASEICKLTSDLRVHGVYNKQLLGYPHCSCCCLLYQLQLWFLWAPVDCGLVWKCTLSKGTSCPHQNTPELPLNPAFALVRRICWCILLEIYTFS